MFRLLKNIMIDNYNVVIGSVLASVSTYFGKDFIKNKLEHLSVNTDKVKKIESIEETTNILQIGVEKVSEIGKNTAIKNENFFSIIYDYLNWFIELLSYFFIQILGYKIFPIVIAFSIFYFFMYILMYFFWVNFVPNTLKSGLKWIIKKFKDTFKDKKDEDGLNDNNIIEEKFTKFTEQLNEISQKLENQKTDIKNFKEGTYKRFIIMGTVIDKTYTELSDLKKNIPLIEKAITNLIEGLNQGLPLVKTRLEEIIKLLEDPENNIIRSIKLKINELETLVKKCNSQELSIFTKLEQIQLTLNDLNILELINSFKKVSELMNNSYLEEKNEVNDLINSELSNHLKFIVSFFTKFQEVFSQPLSDINANITNVNNSLEILKESHNENQKQLQENINNLNSDLKTLNMLINEHSNRLTGMQRTLLFFTNMNQREILTPSYYNLQQLARQHMSLISGVSSFSLIPSESGNFLSASEQLYNLFEEEKELEENKENLVENDQKKEFAQKIQNILKNKYNITIGLTVIIFLITGFFSGSSVNWSDMSNSQKTLELTDRVIHFILETLNRGIPQR